MEQIHADPIRPKLLPQFLKNLMNQLCLSEDYKTRDDGKTKR